MIPVLVAALVAAALLGVALWWVRRENLAVYPVGRAPRRLQPLPVGCELGTALMAAAGQPAQSPEPGEGTGSSGRGPASAGPSAKAPKRKTSNGPTRRTFLRYAWLGSMGGALTAMAGGSLAFLWPNLRGGFGADLDVDSEEAILQYIAENREPYPYPAGRMYLVAYDPALDPDGTYAEITNGAQVMALYQKCVHLGCKVPWCVSAQWFQCPCHGSNYNRWGEYQLGPAPRGLDRFPLRNEEGRIIVSTGTTITGPSREGGVLQQPQEGPSCV